MTTAIPALDRAGKRPMAGARFGSALVLAAGVLVLGLFLQQQKTLTGSVGGFPLDDAYIHLQFAKNLAAGNGLAFLPERPVPGSTSPLWTALLAPGFLISAPVAIAWAKFLGALFFLVAAVDLSGFARDLGASRLTSVSAGVLMVFTETLAFSALSGMEVPLFVVLLVRGMRCFARENARGDFGLASGAMWILLVSALARPEGLLVVAAAVFERCWLKYQGNTSVPPLAMSRWLGSGALLAGTVLLPTAGLFWLWSGSALPTTFAVKAGLGHQWMPTARDVWRFGEVLFRVQPWMTVLAGAGVVSLLRRGRTLLPALWLFGLPLAYSALNSPTQPVLLGNFGRYGFPLLPFVILLGCLGLDDLLRLASERTAGRFKHVLGAFAVAVFLFPAAKTTVNGAGRSALAAHNVAQSDVAGAKWIGQNLPGQRIGTQDIGALGFFTENSIVDLVGLVNPEILPYTRGDRRGAHPSGLGGMFEFLVEHDIDYLLLFPRSYGGLENLQSTKQGLSVVRRWTIDRNVAMAADELVLLKMDSPSTGQP